MSNVSAGTLNYYLADVSTGFATCAGDDRVNTPDISFLGGHYGAAIPVNDALECLDVGPTTDNSTNGRPLTDNVLDFEDLVMFALNYERVNAPQPLDDRPARAGGGERLTIDAPASALAGVGVRGAHPARDGRAAPRACRRLSSGTARSPSRSACDRAGCSSAWAA